jgi:hypothetical protein
LDIVPSHVLGDSVDSSLTRDTLDKGGGERWNYSGAYVFKDIDLLVIIRNIQS